MAYTKQNFEDGQVLKAEHLNNMEQGIADVSKIIVKQGNDTLTWDGDMTGKTCVDIGGAYLVHVSDAVPNLADLSGGGIVYQVTSGVAYAVPFTSEELLDGGNVILYAMGASFAVALEDNAEVEGIVFPKMGTYMLNAPGEVYFGKLTINGYDGFVTEKLDEKYIPGSVILYADGNNYLYANGNTSDTSKRMSASELNSVFLDNKKVLICVSIGGAVTSAYITALNLVVANGYSVVNAYYGNDITSYFSAEYTA